MSGLHRFNVRPMSATYCGSTSARCRKQYQADIRQMSEIHRGSTSARRQERYWADISYRYQADVLEARCRRDVAIIGPTSGRCRKTIEARSRPNVGNDMWPTSYRHQSDVGEALICTGADPGFKKRGGPIYVMYHVACLK